MKQDDKRPPAIDASALMTHNTAGHSSITCTLRLTRGGLEYFTWNPETSVSGQKKSCQKPKRCCIYVTAHNINCLKVGSECCIFRTWHLQCSSFKGQELIET